MSDARITFHEAVEAFYHWPEDDPEPTVDFAERGYEPRPITLSQACEMVSGCPDILPGSYFDLLIRCGLKLDSCTYASAARAMSAAIAEQLTEAC